MIVLVRTVLLLSPRAHIFYLSDMILDGFVYLSCSACERGLIVQPWGQPRSLRTCLTHINHEYIQFSFHLE